LGEGCCERRRKSKRRWKMVVNLTPHSLSIYTQRGVVEIPSAGVARLSQSEEQVGAIGEIPVVKTCYGELQLPEGVEIDGKYVVVSALVAQGAADQLLARGAKAVLVPNTGPTPNGAVRDEQGRIKGVRSLILVAGSLE
jgi:hypothetical protein